MQILLVLPWPSFFPPFFPFNSRFENKMRAGCTDLSCVQLPIVANWNCRCKQLRFIYIFKRKEGGEGRGGGDASGGKEKEK